MEEAPVHRPGDITARRWQPRPTTLVDRRWQVASAICYGSMEVENIYTDVLDITRATVIGLPLHAPERLLAQWWCVCLSRP